MATFKNFVLGKASVVVEEIISLKHMWSENHLDSLPYRRMFVYVSILIV